MRASGKAPATPGPGGPSPGVVAPGVDQSGLRPLRPLKRLLALAAGFAALIVAALCVSAASAGPAQAQGGNYSTVVDNSQQARFYAPGWGTSPWSPDRYGANYAYARPTSAQAARFKVNVPETDQYAVYARWPANRGYNATTPTA